MDKDMNPYIINMMAQEHYNDMLRDAENERLVRRVRQQKASSLMSMVRRLQSSFASRTNAQRSASIYRPEQSDCSLATTN